MTSEPATRSCNRHADCEKADSEAKERAKRDDLKFDHRAHRGADHCHDECCNDWHDLLAYILPESC